MAPAGGARSVRVPSSGGWRSARAYRGVQPHDEPAQRRPVVGLRACAGRPGQWGCEPAADARRGPRGQSRAIALPPPPPRQHDRTPSCSSPRSKPAGLRGSPPPRQRNPGMRSPGTSRPAPRWSCPCYRQWVVRTSTLEDFESLVRRLRPVSTGAGRAGRWDTPGVLRQAGLLRRRRRSHVDVPGGGRTPAGRLPTRGTADRGDRRSPRVSSRR